LKEQEEVIENQILPCLPNEPVLEDYLEKLAN